jgi:putative acetyltransferase
MRVRRAHSADSEAAAAVVRAVYDEYGFTWDAHGYHTDLRDVETAYTAFFVAELGGRIVGTAGLTGHGSLERLYVLPGARGSGAGSALLTAVADGARLLGHPQLEIWSDKRFEDAHRPAEQIAGPRHRSASLSSHRIPPPSSRVSRGR